MIPLAVFTNEKMMAHENMPHHPECPERLSVIVDMIGHEFPEIEIEHSYPVAEDLLLLAHPQTHLDFILDNTPFDGHTVIDPDTHLCPQSYDMALLSVGTSIQAMRAVIDGEAKTAFALSRPPGHHAEYDTAMGFCIFNNAFIAARASRVKTLIIDFDVHHGNGTEDLVKRRVAGGDGNSDIAYASTHQADIFPNSGMEDSPNICNCLLPDGAGSRDFREAITSKIMPFAHNFKPDLIIFSAGFDAHESDDIAGLNLCHDDFAWVVDQFKSLCPRKVSILEGGYNLDTLPISVKHHLKALAKS